MHHSEVQSVLVQQMLLDEMQGRCRKCQANARGAASKFTALGTVQPLQEVKVEFGCLVGRVGGGGIGELARQVQTLARELGTEAWLGGRCKERQGEARRGKGQPTGRPVRKRRESEKECGSAISRAIEPWGKGCSHCSQGFLARIGEETKRAQNTATLVPASCFHCFHCFDTFFTRVPQRARGASRQLLLAETSWRLAAACDLRCGPSCRGAPIHSTPSSNHHRLSASNDSACGISAR